eukprot:jgi/Mesen1/1802/ME000140S00754
MEEAAEHLTERMSRMLNLRRRPGSMDMELPIKGASEETQGVSSNSELLFFHIPIVLCLLGPGELLLAILYSHTWGMLVGLVAFALGLLLAKQKLLLAQKAWLKYPLLVFAAYLSLLVLIRFASIRSGVDMWDTDGARDIHFPTQCAPSELEGCARVAAEHSHPDASARPPKFSVHTTDAVRGVESWARSEGVHVLQSREEPRQSIMNVHSKCSVFMHLRALTFFMGFIDDVYVSLECIQPAATTPGVRSSGYVQVSVQSQLRLGKGDLGVNKRRIGRLLGYLQEELSKEDEADCTRKVGPVLQTASF